MGSRRETVGKREARRRGQSYSVVWPLSGGVVWAEWHVWEG